MTYEEMKAITEAVANALKGAPDMESAEAAPFQPGEPAEVYVNVKGEDIVLTVEPM